MSELDAIPGSGTNGRLRKTDLTAYLKTRRAGPGASAPAADVGVRSVDMAELQKKYPAPLYQVRQMDNVQQKMAEHMVKSVHTSPHVGAISECDLSRIVAFRATAAAQFERTHQLTMTSTDQ